jgi:hypothetical protein
LLTKLGSLARLALSAATQKRDFLRRVGVERPALLRGFLLGRARLIVAPLGLETLLQAFPGMSASAGLDFTRQIIERLQSVLTQDGQVRRLETCLDAPAGAFPADASDGRLAAGLTARDATAPVKGQLQAAGALHAVAGSGTALVHFPEGKPPSAGQVADWLRWAWQQTDVIRLRFLTAAKSRQMTLPASGA